MIDHKITESWLFQGQYLMRECAQDVSAWEALLSISPLCFRRYGETKNMVYHAEMKIGSQRLMFSDIIEFDLIKGNSFFLTITFETKEEVQKAYRILSEGSTILAPMRSTTYSSCVVSLIDKFGFRWGLMTEQPDK
jgi:uncharacterized glyoxalase superfamily protein PhnB